MVGAKGVEAVERALTLLECFRPGVADLSLAEFAKATGEHKSTILRMIVSLEKFGYLSRNEAGRYRLGSTLWRLGTTYRDSFDVTEALRPELQRLSDATQETASFYVRDGESRICLVRVEPVRSIRHALTVGARLPITLGASGKVLRAYGGPAEEGLLPIRSKGYAMSMGERDPEVAAMAVPLLAQSGSLLGALSLSGPVTRFAPDLQDRLLAELMKSAARLGDFGPV